MAENVEVYHERQRLMLCGVHALNNLFCNEADEAAAAVSPFSKASLDCIAEERHRSSREIGAGAMLNPHRSWLGLGNFDVVVLESAVAQRGCSWQAGSPACFLSPRALAGARPARLRQRLPV
jgi:josephin